MLDEIAIQQTLNLYTEGACLGDWQQVMSTFTADATWEIPALKARHQGHDVIQKVMSDFVGRMTYFVQINSPAIIAVDGNTATARCLIRECGKYKDRDETLEVFGRYCDDLIRTPDGWKFTRRVFQPLGMQNYALLPARL
jgi:ketosteroid isomerase-like protein